MHAEDSSGDPTPRPRGLGLPRGRPLGFGIASLGDLQAVEARFQETEEKDWVFKKWK